jgi:tetratricopeptide (TPR) repeat protein
LIEPVDGMLRFHHALIRDVVYAGLTKETRAELHERVGNWLEQRHEGAEEVVGYHLERAYQYRAELQPGAASLPELAQRAGERLAAAGVRAWKGADTPAAVNLLGRAAPLLQELPQRAETLCELGVAQRSTDFHSADVSLSEALAGAKEAGDRRVELRAQIELAYLRLFTDQDASPAELVQLVGDARPVFEELGDERALGRALRLLGYVRGSMEGRCAEWLDAAERAAVYYRRTGWSRAGCFLEAAAALFYGPMPVPEALARCEQLLDESNDRLGRASVLVYLGGLHVLGERYEEGQSLLDDADRIYEELGETYVRADNSARIRGGAHVLAGELESAEAVFRESCATLERVGDKPGLASVAAELAAVLDLQGRLDEADSWSRFAKEHAPAGDKIAQVLWRRVAGRVRTRKGLVAEGEALVLEALELAETTDALSHRGAVLLDLASVLSSANRREEAASRVHQALQLFEAKGNLAAAGLAQSRLAELAVA